MAAARRRGPAVLARLSQRADAIAEQLLRGQGLVAWDREQIIGKAQRALQELQSRAPKGPFGGAPVRVVELRQQPLESLAVVWDYLLQGRAVHVSAAPRACPAALELLAGERLPLGGALTIEGEDPPPQDLATRELVGVRPATTRVAIVLDDTDRELAAYILARVSLRRSGLDPRAVKRVFVSGGLPRLERHLRRLWVGATVGAPSDPEVFAGPVDASLASKFLAAHERWAAAAGVEVLCPGGRLQIGGDSRSYLAPALLRVAWPPADPLFALSDDDGGWVGPVLMLHPLESAAAIDVALADGDVAVERRLIIGPRRRSQKGVDPDLPQSQGALMLERLPPGLPAPRPV